MKKSTIVNSIAALLVLLFVYTATSKLLDFEQFSMQMYNQTVPHLAAKMLIWFVPGSELIASALLLFHRTRGYGLLLSAFLLSLFTGYVSLVLLNYFGRIPCSCGGVLTVLSWPGHLIFNIFFLLLSVLGIFLDHRERRWHTGQ